ncbi:MAG: regulatory protein RecX [Candidatus Omnitrophica bacterium]|nr:regulatory protein RecX [Candidatus Omnitrophota bacterium]
MLNNKQLGQARKAALRLLKYRPRSEKELERRLRLKKIPAQLVELVLGELKKTSLIDDARFAKIWTQDRLKKGYGPRRIEKELNEKGLDRQIIAGSIKNARTFLNASPVLNELLEKRLRRFKKQDDRLKTKQKLFNYLYRRGFELDHVRRYIDELAL